MHSMRSGFVVLAVILAAPVSAQTLADTVSGCLGNPPERTIAGTPGNYLSLLAGLGPGDRLLLAAGTYPGGLPISGTNGAPGRCITIEGPETGARAVFPGRDCCNTVAINDSSYVALRHLDLDGQGRAGDGVKAESPSTFAHHILLDGLRIWGHDADQAIVGISTKCRAWNWVIRRCRITGAGTGLYLGNSDGSAEFVGGLIEHNLVRDTIGYNAQIKHQTGRATGLGIPASAVTIVRHNVFSKAANASTGDDARPNLLVGHFPLSGAGASDVYQIYGNFFYRNPVEALFQGEGNIAFYANTLVNDLVSGHPAVTIQPHNDLPRAVDVFHNTIVSRGGLSVSGGAPGYVQRVTANAVFSDAALSGGTQSANVWAVYSSAASFLAAPFAAPGAGLDLFPLPGALRGPAVASGGSAFTDGNRDFDGAPYDDTFRGAYSGEGTNPGWPLALEGKPVTGGAPSPTPTATTPPPTPTVRPTSTPTATPRPRGPGSGPSDFNGDGRSDLVWQHTDGRVYVWLMNGTAQTGGAWVHAQPLAEWRVVGVADIDRNGGQDLVWQHTDGRVHVWFLNGAAFVGGAYIQAQPLADWRVMGSGDVNGDGWSDLVWQHTDGRVYAWFLNGTTLTGSAAVYAQPLAGWRVRAMGDVNRDGRGDLVLQHADGRVYVWFLNGATLASSAAILAQPLADWIVRGAYDANGNGTLDLVWQHADGRAYVWFLNGTAQVGGQWVYAQPLPDWTLVAAK
jgi:hypothetical protein